MLLSENGGDDRASGVQKTHFDIKSVGNFCCGSTKSTLTCYHLCEIEKSKIWLGFPCVVGSEGVCQDNES